MRRVQHRAGPQQQPVDVAAAERGGRDVDGQFLAVAQHRDRDLGPARSRAPRRGTGSPAAVDRRAAGRPAQHAPPRASRPTTPRDAQRLACGPSSASSCATQASARPSLRACGERHGRELDLERVQRTCRSRTASTSSCDQVDRHAAVDLHQVAAGLDAKLDHSARTAPSRSTSTPSKSVGPLTRLATSRFASRNCSVRDSGKLHGVDRRRPWSRRAHPGVAAAGRPRSPSRRPRSSRGIERAAARPACRRAAPGRRPPAPGCAADARTPRAPGSRACPPRSGARRRRATGTVLRSTTTRPRAASTTGRCRGSCAR